MKSLIFLLALTVLLFGALPGMTLRAYAATRSGRGGMCPLRREGPRNRSADYSDVIAHIRRDLPKQLAAVGVPGAAMALVDDQQIVWADGFGFADNVRKTPVTADTLFSLQSISKTYTATVFMKTVQKGWFRVDDLIRKGIPEFTIRSRFGNNAMDKITFRRLLSHWAGLCHEAPVGNNYGAWHCTFEEHARSICTTWLKSPVGARYRYSNLGIDLVGFALQRRSGVPFADLMKQELFDPLGMNSSTFSHAEAARSANLARGHIGGVPIPDLEIPMLAAGGMYSTVCDMARFLSFHLAEGAVGGKRVMNASVLKRMVTPQYCRKGQRAGYGLGIFSRPYHGATLLYHGGGGYGYQTYQAWIPEYKLGVVILTNGDEAGDLVGDVSDAALQAMIRAKYGAVPPEKPLRWTGRPVVTLPIEALRRLEGTYKATGQLVTFRVEGNRLHFLRNRQNIPLNAHSPVLFTRADGQEMYAFYEDAGGKIAGSLNLGDGGQDDMVLNDTPTDSPGPNRPEWARYIGRYEASAYGQRDEKRITLKNGYLYYNGQLKLQEYRPGLFFTADGDSVEFDGDRMDYGNRHFHRIDSSATEGKREP